MKAPRKPTTRNLARLEVRDVMCGRLRVLPPDASISEALRLFEEKRFHHAVIERDGKLLGMLSDRDLLPILSAPAARSCAMPAPAVVADVMTRRVETTSPDERIAGALIRMLEHGVNALAVVEAGRPIGILTSSDFLTLLLDLSIGDYVAHPTGPARSRKRVPTRRDRRAVKLSAKSVKPL